MKAQHIAVFIEQRGGVLLEVGFELLGKARELADISSGTVTALLLGRDVAALADDLITYGADTVLQADSPILDPYRLMPYTSILAETCKTYDPDILLFGATSMGMELAPRLAARLNTGLSAHCIDLRLDSDGKLLQMVPGWGGGVVATIKCPDHRPQMATVMPGVMKKIKPVQRSGQRIGLAVPDDLDVTGPKVLEVHIEEPKGMPLEKADVVVAGGWGLGGGEGWTLLEELARLLCGAVGATRPPVDEGWVPESQMIGQSGKTVRPRLYIGVGISGMSHHVVGMDQSGCIMAVNKDPNAAIFKVSDVAVVADYREIIPLLIEEVRARIPDSRIDTCEVP
ncbi:MAG: electron transfer flavoprotein subunit alpha/FixB family protein [Pseudomonadota bacterium]|uniref:Electron transfer flavoprotein subunit alpha/FixB family protein n=1 Tax=Candidatus Desulfatibia profunda TaxID=2841695 RepID=A0A8J6TM56_9BACT|nr:electron transfer flavoprotein subunit alpha/FixB family protein [Candidatus Desulfatibia profunda]MBL7179181.1 electron transfer flavoprotein subunit alpha/FixB family protein [Desulfobacterales bacterium]